MAFKAAGNREEPGTLIEVIFDNGLELTCSKNDRL
jgi:hypothetical protein